uniref:Uncharacterized protein n=1 Tax=Arundo donax TaxID=35708 RepID=A0A0A9CM17_ARUDO
MSLYKITRSHMQKNFIILRALNFFP